MLSSYYQSWVRNCEDELSLAAPRAQGTIGLIAVLLFLPACHARSQVADRNGDGHIQILCLGDSNTENPRSPDQPSWCELLAQEHPAWKVVNGGVRFARAGGSCLLCGPVLLKVALSEGPPDIVLIALGTNDVFGFQNSADAVVDALLALRDQASAANVDAFIATIPPTYESTAKGVRADQQIPLINALLELRVPANRLIDFHTDMTLTDFLPGGLHLNHSGQEKRAAAAERALTGN